MLRLPLAVGAAVCTLCLCAMAAAGGQSAPVGPRAAGQAVAALVGANPAPAPKTAKEAGGTNLWLIGLGVAAVVGVGALIIDDEAGDSSS